MKKVTHQDLKASFKRLTGKDYDAMVIEQGFKNLQHIDGLAGEEEYLAIKEIEKDEFTFCPDCGRELTVMVEPNHPDPNDYPVGVYCENCGYQEMF